MTVQEHAVGVRRLAHDLNNLLFVIGGHCELLNVYCEGSPEARADLAVVAETVSRASTLTAELRAMAIAVASGHETAVNSTELHVASR